MNGLTTDDDRTCGLRDLNCPETQGKNGPDITNMNTMGKEYDTSCALQDMNCTGDQ